MTTFPIFFLKTCQPCANVIFVRLCLSSLLAKTKLGHFQSKDKSFKFLAAAFNLTLDVNYISLNRWELFPKHVVFSE